MATMYSKENELQIGDWLEDFRLIWISRNSL